MQEFNKGVYDYIIATDETANYDETQPAQDQQLEVAAEPASEEKNPEDDMTMGDEDEEHASDIAEGQSVLN